MSCRALETVGRAWAAMNMQAWIQQLSHAWTTRLSGVIMHAVR